MSFTHPDAWDDVPFDLVAGEILQEVCLTLNELELVLGRGDPGTDGTLWKYLLEDHPDNAYTGDPGTPTYAVFTEWPRENTGSISTPVWGDLVTFPAPGDFNGIANDQRVLVEIIHRARTSVRVALGKVATNTNHSVTHSAATTPAFWWDAAVKIRPLVVVDGRYHLGGAMSNADIWTAAGRDGQTSNLLADEWDDDLEHTEVTDPLTKTRLTEAIDELLDLLGLVRYVAHFPMPYAPIAAAGAIDFEYWKTPSLKPWVMMDPNANVGTDQLVEGQARECPDHIHLGASESGGAAANADAAWTHLVAGTTWRHDSDGISGYYPIDAEIQEIQNYDTGCSVLKLQYLANQRRIEHLLGINPLTEWAPAGTLVKRVFVVSAYAYSTGDASAAIAADVDGEAISLPLAGVDPGGGNPNAFVRHTEIADWPAAGTYFSSTLPASNPFLGTSARTGRQLVVPSYAPGSFGVVGSPPIVPSGYINNTSPGHYEIRDLSGSLTHI